MKKYENKYSNVRVVTQENKGISQARNIGLEHAKGKYVGFIDNDDFVVPEYINKLMERAYQTKADIVKCGYYRYSSSNQKVLKDIFYKDVSISGNIGERIVEFKGFVWGGVMLKSMWNNMKFLVGFWYEDMIMRLILMRKCKQFEYIGE